MIKRGSFLLTIGLVIGLLLGLTIRGFEAYLAGELEALLREEARLACNCSLKIEECQFSILTLNAYAQGIEIKTPDASTLKVKRMTGSFGITRILDKILNLRNLKLQGAVANGIGANSSAFQFINHLAAPLPAGEAPGDWRIKLQGLSVNDSKFSHNFEHGSLIGENLKLTLIRNKQNDIEMTPFIGKLSYSATGTKQTFNLGEIRSFLVVKDEQTEFSNIRISAPELTATGKAITYPNDNNHLQGESFISLSDKALNLSNFMQGELNSETEISGTLESPIFSGPLENNGDISVIARGEDLLKISSLKAQHKFSFEQDCPTYQISSLSGTGNNGSINLELPLTISNDRLEGVFQITADRFSRGALLSDRIEATIELSGSLDKPTVKISGQAANNTLSVYKLPDMTFSLLSTAESIDFKIIEKEQQRLEAIGKLLYQDGYRVEQASLNLNNYPMVASEPDEEYLINTIRLSGNSTLEGPLDLNKLSGEGDLKISSTHFSGEAALQGKALLKEGSLNVSVFNDSKSIDSNLKLNLNIQPSGQLSLSLNNFKPAEYIPSFRCFKTTLQGSYDFDLSTFRKGNGTLNLDQLSVGCSPYSAELVKPFSAKIAEGHLNLSSMQVESAQTLLTLDGGISPDGIDLTADGSLHLNSLLPLLPSVDDIQGRMTASVNISGPFEDLELEGAADIDRGSLSIESANLSIESINGSFDFFENYIITEGLTGKLNGGRVTLTGDFNPFEFEKSNASLELNDITLEPLPNISQVFSGKVTVEQSSEGIPEINGNIKIQNAVIEKTLNLQTLLTSMTDYVFSVQDNKRKLQKVPDCRLDLKITAPRNVFIISNLMEAELTANVHLSNTLANPKLTGEMAVISGWFGIRDRSFNINSGKIIFKPSSLIPEISIIGEAQVFSRQGDSIIIFAEASGPLSDPKLNLSSDSNLNQQEILDLLVTRRSSGQSPYRLLSQSTAQKNQHWLFGEDTDSTLTKFVADLATIDNLFIEPELNLQTGLTEPTLVAEKKLTEKIILTGQSYLSGDARIEIEHKLTPQLSIAGIFDTLIAQENTSIGADLTYTILTNKQRNLKLDIKGNSFLSKLEITSKLHLSPYSRIAKAELPELVEKLLSAYRGQGFLNTSVEIFCEKEKVFCRKMLISVQEGRRSRISTVKIRGRVPEELDKTDIKKKLLRKYATLRVLNLAKKEITRNLRSEGYISARPSIEYLPDYNNKVKAKIRLQSGRPTSFSFSGNKAFSAEDFLQTINLFNRKQPFGKNTINILIERIEKLYRDAGFLYATISYDIDQESSHERINYLITIQEEDPVTVSKVELTGNSHLSSEEIIKLLSEQSVLIQENLLHPEYAIAEELDSYSLQLQSIYIREGFPNAAVRYRIYNDIIPGKVIINYTISEGDPLKADWIEIEGVPEGIHLPPLPRPPYSIPKANDYIEETVNELNNSGYFYPSISSTFRQKEKKLLMTVHPGQRTMIEEIIIEGTQKISERDVLAKLKFKVGDTWNKNTISQSRTSLLKTGLFSSVEIIPLDGKLDSEIEALLIKINERPLQVFEIGTGINSELGFHIFGKATDKQLFRDGRTLSLRLDGYFDYDNDDVTQGVASLRYYHPEIFQTEENYSANLRFQRLDLSTLPYDLDRFILDNSIFGSDSKTFNYIVGHTASIENLADVEPDVILSPDDEGDLFLSYLTSRVTFDYRNNPINPSDGYNITLGAKLSAKPLASEADFFSLTAETALLYPLSERFLIAEKFHCSSAWEYGDTEVVPISQRYFTGGRRSVRGYKENSLGPQGEDGDATGGDLNTFNNLELRYLITDSISIHTFFDSGTVFLQDRSVNFDDLRFSAGYGARYHSAIGPISLHIGHPIDREDGEASTRLHFDIGSSF